MNRFFARGATAALVLALQSPGSAAVAASPVPREIDTAKSTALFSVSHIWVENVTGSVPIVSGSVTLPSGSTIPTSASAVLDATKIATGDADRDAALKSPDFFDTKVFPTWTFVSAQIAPHGPGEFEMEGNVTIHGVTRPVRLTVTIGGTSGQPHYHAVGEIDRQAFGMSKTRLDPVIGTNVDVTLDIVMKSPPVSAVP